MNRSELASLLREHRQEHLLPYYDRLPQSGKDGFASQLEKVDWRLVGLALDKSRRQQRGFFEPLAGMSIPQIESNRDSYNAAGLRALRAGKVAAVLLAGGQGTRLGCDGPKGTVDIGLTKPLYIFEALFNNLISVVRQADVWIPFYIMTSDKTHSETLAFLRRHEFFGYPEEYITFFVQDMAPSVDFNGRLLMEAPGRLALSPNGNGGWFSSMAGAGLLDGLHRRGIGWLNVFAVDNILQKIADPVFVGAVIASGKSCGAKAVRKANPGERVGVLCLEDGRPSIVEYYEMTDEMRTMKNAGGDLSYAFGVILNYLFRVDKLETIRRPDLPVHVVEKKIPYMTIEGDTIEPEEPNGYKFEELVLDMVQLFDDCLPFEVDREKEFAPIKNASGDDSVDTARRLLEKNGVVL